MQAFYTLLGSNLEKNSQQVAQQLLFLKTWKCIVLDVVPENFIRASLKRNIRHYDSSQVAERTGDL